MLYSLSFCMSENICHSVLFCPVLLYLKDNLVMCKIRAQVFIFPTTFNVAEKKSNARLNLYYLIIDDFDIFVPNYLKNAFFVFEV